jgi:hypothetical protein
MFITCICSRYFVKLSPLLSFSNQSRSDVSLSGKLLKIFLKDNCILLKKTCIYGIGSRIFFTNVWDYFCSCDSISRLLSWASTVNRIILCNNKCCLIIVKQRNCCCHCNKISVCLKTRLCCSINRLEVKSSCCSYAVFSCKRIFTCIIHWNQSRA